MATSRGKCFSTNFAILLVLYVFIVVTSAQITFSRQWRRGKHQSDDKAIGMENGEFTFNRVIRAEDPHGVLQTIERLANTPSSADVDDYVSGRIWKRTNTLIGSPYQMLPSVQLVPIFRKFKRSIGRVRSPYYFFCR